MCCRKIFVEAKQKRQQWGLNMGDFLSDLRLPRKASLSVANKSAPSPEMTRYGLHSSIKRRQKAVTKEVVACVHSCSVLAGQWCWQTAPDQCIGVVEKAACGDVGTSPDWPSGSEVELCE